MADVSTQRPFSGLGETNALFYTVQRILSQMHTSTLVKVIACTNAGGVDPVGFVDIQPMVNMLDGEGKAFPHGTIHHIPYSRIQGGNNAVILDPEPGDIGIAIFAERDISSVKATRDIANPGTLRQFDWADAVYIGGVLNGAPTQYVQFNAAGMVLVSPTKISLQAPNIEFVGTVAQSGGPMTAAQSFSSPTVAGTVSMTVNGKDVEHHYHSGVSTGTGNTGEMVN